MKGDIMTNYYKSVDECFNNFNQEVLSWDQLDEWDESGYIKVTKNGEVTYHPDFDDYIVWSECYSQQLFVTKDKYEAMGWFKAYCKLILKV